MKVRTLAIPIRVVDFSETSQVASLFSRDCGLVEGIAKGAYREKSSFQGPFDLAVLYEIVFAERRTGLCVLTESTVLDGFRGLRACWERQVAAFHIVEFLRAVASTGAPEPSLFDLAVEILLEISSSSAERIGARVARFDARALRVLGLLAPLDACVVCGKRWPGSNRGAIVSARAGGLLCSRCRESGSYPGLSLPGAAVHVLRCLSGPQCFWSDVDAKWAAVGRSIRCATSHLRNHLLERDFLCLKTYSAP